MPYRIAIDGDRRLIVKPEGDVTWRTRWPCCRCWRSTAVRAPRGGAAGPAEDRLYPDVTAMFRLLPKKPGKPVNMPLALVVDGGVGRAESPTNSPRLPIPLAVASACSPN